MDEINRMFSITGGWGNVSGPGLFMFRMTTSALVSSVFMGMTGASMSAIFYDTATIPFMLSACTGFIFGAVAFYRDSLRKAARAIDRYPRLLQLHLDANFSHRGFDTWTLSRLNSRTFGVNWRMQSMLIAAWMTARPTIERIKDAQEEVLVNKYSGVDTVEEKEE